MAYIGRQLARGENKLFDDISSSFNGSTTTFNLTVSSVATATATPYQLFVSLGGVMQKPNTDFTTAGNQITFTTAPAAGLSCWIMMQGDTIDQAAIPDASVIPSKISGSNFAFSGDLRLKDADGSHYVGFASPTTVASNKVWTLPAADGSPSQYLQTNGSGVLTWATVSVGGGTGIDFNDSVKTRYGTGNDFEIYFNGTNSILTTVAAHGQFYMSDKHEFRSKSNSSGDRFITANYSTGTDPGVHLWWSDASGGTKKFSTTATGVAVTGALTVSTNATITGNLTVSGTTTTINTQTLDVEDKNVVIGKVSSPSDTTADGGGWTLKGASDKTFNWVNSTDAWTSSEHIHLLDNKKLFVGGASGTTDGLEIFHNGSNSYIKDSGTGNLEILSSQVNIQNAAQTEWMAKFIQDGAVELYHNHVKKIETTTGGINVTGAITVNGSALASGNTVDLVADGAIAAGKPVIITTSGEAQQIKIMGTADGPGGFGNNWNPLSGYGLTSAQNCQDQQYPDYIINGFSNGGADVRFKAYNVVTGSNSGGSLMLGSGSGIGNSSKIGGLIYLEYLDLFLCSNTEGSDQNTGTGHSKMITFSHGGSGGLTLKYVVSSNLTNTKIHDIIYAKQSSTVDTYFSVVDQVGGLKILGLSSVYSNGNVQPGTDTLVVTTDACIMARMKFNSDKSKFIILYQKWNNRKLYAKGGTWDGTNGASSGITLGSEFTVINAALDSQPFEWQRGVDLACDLSSGRWVAAYEYGSQSKVICLTLSGTTVSMGTQLTVDTQNPDGKFRIINNHSVANCVTWAGLSSVGMGAVNILISGTNTLTLSGSVRQAYGPGPDNDCNVGMASGVVKNSNVSMAEAAYLLWRRNGSEPRAMRMDTAAAATNKSSSNENFLGFAEDAISDGNSGTIKLPGNVVSNQSGLTAGTRYKVNDDGTLSASWYNTAVGGTAIASDKLIINRAG